MTSRSHRFALSLVGASPLVFAAAPAHAAPPVVVTITIDDGIEDVVNDDATREALADGSIVHTNANADDAFELYRQVLTDEDQVLNEQRCPNVGEVGSPRQQGEREDCDLPATMYVNYPRFDERGFLTTEQIRDLESWGHEIGGHSAHHLNLAYLESESATEFVPGEQLRQVCWDRRRLSGVATRDPSKTPNGSFNIFSFAYPRGVYAWPKPATDPWQFDRFGAPVPELSGDETRQIVGRDYPGAQQCGYRSARIVGVAANTKACRDRDPSTPCVWAENTRPADPFALIAPASISDDHRLDYPVVPPNDDGNGIYDRVEEYEARANSVKGWVDNAIANPPETGRNWVMLVLHSYCFLHQCNRYGIQYHDFVDLATWLRQKQRAGEIEIRTVSDVLGHHKEIRVGTPPLPTPVTAVQNGDMSEDINRDLLPDCFMSSGAGPTPRADADNNGDGIANDGHGGDRWYGWMLVVNGATTSRLLTRTDTGGCSPVVKPGNQYRLSFYYRRPSAPRSCGYFDDDTSRPCPLNYTTEAPTGEPPKYHLAYAFRRPVGFEGHDVDHDGYWGGFSRVNIASPTPDWQLAEAIVDVPPSVNAIAFGPDILHYEASGRVAMDVDDVSYCRVTDDPTDPVPACDP
ncbi:MAG: hypothetical protein B7733_25085 [Myxococcales bacterium FL481]|nr:MAG: hypothetical protein B7733_25085 [Myxococcales bacterium FL481]